MGSGHLPYRMGRAGPDKQITACLPALVVCHFYTVRTSLQII